MSQREGQEHHLIHMLVYEWQSLQYDISASKNATEEAGMEGAKDETGEARAGNRDKNGGVAPSYGMLFSCVLFFEP